MILSKYLQPLKNAYKVLYKFFNMSINVKISSYLESGRVQKTERDLVIVENLPQQNYQNYVLDVLQQMYESLNNWKMGYVSVCATSENQFDISAKD